MKLQKLPKRVKFLLGSILLILMGGSIVGGDSTYLIAIIITLLLVASGFMIKHKSSKSSSQESNEDDINSMEKELESKENDIKDDEPQQRNIKEINHKHGKEEFDEIKSVKLPKLSKEKYQMKYGYTDYSENPYQTDIKQIHNKYTSPNQDYDFELKVNEAICSTPIFNLRTLHGMNFYWNFAIHNFDNKKLNNLIMCRDIHKWMETSSLSNEDLEDEFCPIYYITKKDEDKNSEVVVFEYLKIFIHTDKEGKKNAFIQKGLDYMKIEKYINELIDNGIIKDLLCDSNYHSYNLGNSNDVNQFLDSLLSLVLPPENAVGEVMTLDIKHNCENKNAYEFMYNTLNFESTAFNTVI